MRALLLLAVATLGIFVALHLGLGPVAPTVTARFDGLVDTAGRPFASLEATGRYKLVAYGYTACPDACPATLTKLHAVLESLSADTAPLTPVFITLDPAHDTAAVLAAYVHHFDSRIVGLTGDLQSLQQSAAQLSALPTEPEPAQTPDGGPNHAVRLYLLSPQNALLRTYELEDPTHLIASDVHRRLAPTG
jgi:protein SCO1/2